MAQLVILHWKIFGEEPISDKKGREMDTPFMMRRIHRFGLAQPAHLFMLARLRLITLFVKFVALGDLTQQMNNKQHICLQVPPYLLHRTR